MALTAAMIWSADGYSTAEVEAMLKRCDNGAEMLRERGGSSKAIPDVGLVACTKKGA
jgi:hypothetical protein